MQKSRPGHKFSAKQRTTDVLIDEQVDFESLLLSPPLVKGLTDSGFEKPSPIQLKAIPLGRCGLDLIAQAKSGTGKTCVFSVIALETINTDSNASQVLILAPTREIAVQIKDVTTAIGCHIKGLSCQVFIGGMPLEDDKKALKGCHIVVGSPGRVKYLIENNHLKTDSIRMFILDEADKLLDDSFQEQINWIYSTLPSNKQMMAFSATYPEYLANHLTRYMREPTFVRLNAADPTLQGIKQFYCTVPFHHLPHKVFQEKVDRLLELLSKVNFHQCLLFSNYQIRAQSLSSTLCSKGWPATFIAGNQSQQKRLQAMEKLKDFKCRILISTDLTARGIDAENVNLVVNMDIPRDGETYLHRIGRAGRFGTKGIAVTFVAKGKEQKDLKELEKSIGIILQPLPESIPESFMVSMSPSNPSQLEKDVIEVNILHNKPNKSSKTDQTKHESQTEDSSIDNVPLPDGDVNCNADNVEEELFGIMRSAQTTQDGIVNEECKILAPVDTSCSKEHENDFISSVCSDSSIIQSLQVRNIDQNSTTTNKFANKLPKCTRDKAYINDSVAKTEKGSTVILSAESSADVMCNAPLGKVSVASNDVDLKCASSIPSKQILPSAQEFDKDFEDYLASLSCKPLNNLQKCDSEKKEDLEDLKFGMLPSAQEFDQDFEDYLSLTNKPQNSLQNCDNTLKTETDNVSLAMLASVQEFDQDFEEYLALTDELQNCEQIYENYPDINENVTLGCHKKVKGSIDSSEEYGDIGVDGCRKSSRNNDGGDDGGGDSDVDGGVSGDEDDGGVCDVDDSGNDDGGDSDDYSGVSDADDDSDDDDKSCHSDIVAVMGSLILKANDSDNRVTNYDKNDHDNNGGASSNVDDDDNVDSDADGSSSNDDVDDNDVDNSDDDSDSISAIDADDIDDTDDGKDDGDESDGDVSCGSHICSKILDGISSADDLLCAKNDSKTQYQGSGNSKSNGDVQQQQQFNQKQTINHPDKCKKEEKYIHKQQTGGGDKSCYYGNRASNQWSIGNHGDDMLRPSAFQSNDGYQAEVDEMNYYGNTEHPTHYYENSLENQSRYGSYYDRPWANTHYYGNTDINTQLSNHSNSDYQTHQPKHQTYQRWEAGASYHGNHVNSQCCYGNTDYSTYGNQHYDSYPSGETDMSFHGNADVASKSCKCHLNSHQRVGHGSTSRTASGGVDLEWQGIWNNAFHTINNMIVQFGRQHTK